MLSLIKFALLLFLTIMLVNHRFTVSESDYDFDHSLFDIRDKKSDNRHNQNLRATSSSSETKESNGHSINIHEKLQDSKSSIQQILNLIYNRYELFDTVGEQFFLTTANINHNTWDLLKFKLAHKFIQSQLLKIKRSTSAIKRKSSCNEIKRKLSYHLNNHNNNNNHRATRSLKQRPESKKNIQHHQNDTKIILSSKYMNSKNSTNTIDINSGHNDSDNDSDSDSGSGITDDVISFLMIFGGSSVTAGHDNYFNESFPMIVKKRLHTAFSQLDIDLIVRNIAQGANPCIPYTFCYESMGGLDPDFIGWEQSYNCGHDIGAFELTARIAQFSKNRAVVYYSASGAWLPTDCPRHNPLITSSSNKAKSSRVTTDFTASFLALDSISNSSSSSTMQQQQPQLPSYSLPYCSEQWSPASLPLAEQNKHTAWKPSSDEVAYYKNLLDKYYNAQPSISRFIADPVYKPWLHGFNLWEANPLCTYHHNPKESTSTSNASNTKEKRKDKDKLNLESIDSQGVNTAAAATRKKPTSVPSLAPITAVTSPAISPVILPVMNNCNGFEAVEKCHLKFMRYEASLYSSGTGGAAWHPSRAFHMLRGEMIVWQYGLILLDMILMVENDIQQATLAMAAADKEKKPSWVEDVLLAFEKSYNTKLTAMYKEFIPSPTRHSKHCTDKLHCNLRPICFTNFKPHYTLFTLTSTLVGITNWMLEDNEYSAWSKKYGYLDAKTAYSTTNAANDSYLTFQVSIRSTKHLWICGGGLEHVNVYVNLASEFDGINQQTSVNESGDESIINKQIADKLQASKSMSTPWPRIKSLSYAKDCHMIHDLPSEKLFVSLILKYASSHENAVAEQKLKDVKITKSSLSHIITWP